jgi:hypothetical protein
LRNAGLRIAVLEAGEVCAATTAAGNLRSRETAQERSDLEPHEIAADAPS